MFCPLSLRRRRSRRSLASRSTFRSCLGPVCLKRDLLAEMAADASDVVTPQAMRALSQRLLVLLVQLARSAVEKHDSGISLSVEASRRFRFGRPARFEELRGGHFRRGCGGRRLWNAVFSPPLPPHTVRRHVFLGCALAYFDSFSERPPCLTATTSAATAASSVAVRESSTTRPLWLAGSS